MKFLVIVVLVLSAQVWAHSGRTDSSGCHHDHKNGGYHCHKSDSIEPGTTRTPASIKKMKERKEEPKQKTAL